MRFEPTSGLWRHRDGVGRVPYSLRDIDYTAGTMSYDRRPAQHADTGSTEHLADHLAVARQLLDDAVARPPTALPAPTTTDDFETLRWFPYPGE